MIVGTAGHIDHGKTTLVRALTGVDTDRLPEERRRGISIELGYAFMEVPGLAERIGFIDVPGHERLVHTMLAGATGIDHALLLVAADDGVMPQTREHLAVLSLLGLTSGAVVITKADRVDAARIEAVRQEVQALMAQTPLQDAPIHVVSAATGAGVAALRESLAALARDRATRQTGGAAAPCAEPEPEQGFRLAIDRAFTLTGAGTVVTGTVHRGRVRVGDTLTLVPAQQTVRVRSLHAQNQPVDEAHAGQRCAVAVVGVDRDAIARGDWLVSPMLAHATQRVDARLTLWHEESKTLRSGSPVTLHLGACAVPATVAILDRDVLAPGQSACVQIVTRRPIGAWHGDRVVLRDGSATRTLAGGTVLDPFAPVRYRRTPQRLAELEAAQAPQADQMLALLLKLAPHGVDLERFRRAHGLLNLSGVPADALVYRDAQGTWAMGASAMEQARATVVKVLAEFHHQQPDELGPASSRLRRLALPRLPDPLWQALLARWMQTGVLVGQGAFVHLPEHGVRLSAAEQRLSQKVTPWLEQAAFDGIWVRDLAARIGEPEPLLRSTLIRMARRGELHQVVKDLCFAPATIRSLARRAQEVATRHQGEILAADFRDATGLGRKRAIQILEYFDRIGILRRVGDVHRLRTDSPVLEESEAPV